MSVASDGTEANGQSWSLPNTISADGRYVAFDSVASNLVPAASCLLALSSLTSVGVNLYIRDNAILPTAQAEALVAQLIDFTGNVYISGNLE